MAMCPKHLTLFPKENPNSTSPFFLKKTLTMVPTPKTYHYFSELRTIPRHLTMNYSHKNHRFTMNSRVNPSFLFVLFWSRPTAGPFPTSPRPSRRHPPGGARCPRRRLEATGEVETRRGGFEGGEISQSLGGSLALKNAELMVSSW